MNFTGEQYVSHGDRKNKSNFLLTKNRYARYTRYDGPGMISLYGEACAQGSFELGQILASFGEYFERNAVRYYAYCNDFETRLLTVFKYMKEIVDIN